MAKTLIRRTQIAGVSGAVEDNLASFDVNGRVKDSGRTTAGLFEIDVNGGLMPITTTLLDTYWELDGNDDLEPKAA